MKKITIISGEKHSGKTTKLLEIISDFKLRDISYTGILAIGTFKNNQRHSFDIVDISTQEKMEFMSVEPSIGSDKIGRFYINKNALEFGNRVLEKAIISNAKYLIIDEIGPLELDEKGWAPILNKSIETNRNIIISVRKELLNDILKKFKISEFELIEI